MEGCMNNKGIGAIFCLISAVLASTRYLAAAIYMSNVTSWSHKMFQDGFISNSSPCFVSPSAFFRIVNEISVTLHFRIPQPGVESVRPGIPDGGVKRKNLYLRKHALDFPHHKDAISFPKVLRINEYPSDIQRASLAEQYCSAKDHAVLINQFEQMIHPGHSDMERDGLIPGRTAGTSGSHLRITVKSQPGDAGQYQGVRSPGFHEL